MSFVLGLDSGGSKTLAAIADRSGTILRRWQGPGFDPQRLPGWDVLLGEAVAALCGGETPAAAVLGLPMHGEIAALSEHQRQTAAALLSCPHLVLNDVEVAYDGAFTGAGGVLVLAGTGSMAWAKMRGRSLRIGGWGDVFGDEGSAFWIGREALSLASRALDGRGDASQFADAMLAACGCQAAQLVGWAYGQDNVRAAVAGLAQHVDALAETGDETATRLLHAAAEMLAAHVAAARRSLDHPVLDWSYAGSVFASRTITAHLSRLLGPPSPPRLAPTGGALWRAAGLAGWETDAGFFATLSACLNKP